MAHLARDGVESRTVSVIADGRIRAVAETRGNPHRTAAATHEKRDALVVRDSLRRVEIGNTCPPAGSPEQRVLVPD